ncbi:hypothetical protein BGX34_003653 [Mortierella sp. NVP85]|nr:hypothetical protein BGX34_003653 [Mortierella sp. NVP85]
MLRLGRRGIVLSLFINALNIILYLTILIAACLNIAEASINLIILNVFAAIPFNLYGGIMVVCMGLAFLMLSYVKLVPPLDGLLLNYKKLDQWKEQKHFRDQLEAQRIFEEQLQQEQNLTRPVPAHHHPTSMTAHAPMMAVSSPHQPKAFSAIHSGSTSFSSAGVGVGATSSGGVDTPASMFSPSTSQRPSNYPRLTPQAQQHQRVDQERQLQYHQPPKHHGSTSDVGSEKSPQEQEAHTVDGTAVGRGKGCGAHGSSSQETGEEGMTALPWPSASAVSPPPTRRGSAADSEPESPLQYLIVDDPSEATPTVTFGGKAGWNQSGSLDDGILKSALHQGDKTSRSLQQQQQFPLRTTNKPAPPHDPFRRASLPSKQLINAAPLSNSASGTSATAKGRRGHYQSLYQLSEPPGQPDSIHPLQSYHDPSARSNQAHAAIASENTSQPPQRPMASSTQQQRPPVFKQDTVPQHHHMPDIILTLPTPAEPINTSRREGYFAM